MAKAHYDIHATFAGEVPTPPWPHRAVGREHAWSFTDADFARIPEVRAWIGAHGGTIAAEHGGVGPTSELADGSAYLLLSGARYTQRKPLVGLAQTTTPCAACGLAIHTLTATGEPLRLVGPKPPAPVTRLAWPGVWLVTSEVRAALEGARGVELLPVALGRGDVRWVMRPTHEIRGIAYPFGPPPCTACGRAQRLYAHGQDFVLPRYSLSLVLPRETDIDWGWHVLYGQGMPIASAHAARRLSAVVPGLSGMRLAIGTDADAFLPAALRA